MCVPKGARELANKERSLPVTWGDDLTLRAKVTDHCGLACNFCHNEGTPVTADNRSGLPFVSGGGRTGRVSIYTGTNGVDFVAEDMQPDEEYREALTAMRDALRLDELHLTGGEPTLHTKLDGLVAVATEVGYSVGITSNGEAGRLAIPKAAAAGLQKVNFSIFGTTAAELAEIQGAKYKSLRLSQAKIVALDRSIREAHDHGVKVSANIVVPDRTHAPRVLRLVEAYGEIATIRLLNSLDDGEESMTAIWDILDSLGARPVERMQSRGVSGCRVRYELPNGRSMYFKQIRQVYLTDLCKKCTFHPSNEGGCEEGFYGLRLYRAQGRGYLVGVCIQRMDQVLPVSEFVMPSLREQVLELRAEGTGQDA